MKKKKLEFMKKIVVWAISLVTVFFIASMIDWILNRMTPASELTNLIGLLITGVIVSYAGKAGVENYQKIKMFGSPNSSDNESVDQDSPP